jgi:hypothetical protein
MIRPQKNETLTSLAVSVQCTVTPMQNTVYGIDGENVRHQNLLQTILYTICCTIQCKIHWLLNEKLQIRNKILIIKKIPSERFYAIM